MSSIFTILSEKSISFHDSPPIFNASQRKHYFYINSVLEEFLKTKIRGKKNRAFFLLCYGYFRATAQFYETVSEKDVQFIANRFELTDLDISEYNAKTRKTHQNLILDLLRFSSFGEKGENIARTEAETTTRSQELPAKCFEKVATKLISSRIEVPTYKVLAKIITDAYKSHEIKLIEAVDKNLTQEDKNLLDTLFEQTSKDDGRAPYKLTTLKRFNQSTKPAKIKTNLEASDELKPLFDIADPIIKKLDLNKEGIIFYAKSVDSANINHLHRKKSPDRYLKLIAFITHQYYSLQETLIATLLSAVKTSFNKADKEAREEYLKNRHKRNDHATALVSTSENLLEKLEQARAILMDENLPDDEKVEAALVLLSPRKVNTEEAASDIQAVKDDTEAVSGEALLMLKLEEESLKLQRRCNEIILRLDFNSLTEKSKLMEAISKFKDKNGKVDDTFPIGFMSSNRQKYVDTIDKFKVPLWKVLFYKAISDSIKSGTLSLVNTYKYRDIEDYLIPKSLWMENQNKYLKNAGMLEFKNFEEVIEFHKLELHKQYMETNTHIAEQQNPHVRSRGNGGFTFLGNRNTQLEDLIIHENSIELYPKKEFITLSEAISTVNKATGFIEEFHHREHKRSGTFPDEKLAYAGIISLGCHLGVKRFAKLANISESALDTTVENHFSIENLREASTQINRYMDQMPVANLFEKGYTSSDGQKYLVDADSFNANYSFKYGGKDMVVAAYSFIDSRNLFFHSEVISGSEREAHYMIDGVLRNDVVKSIMHCTDTHGYTEAVFGLSHLMGISFAPRIKQVQKELLYSFANRSTYTKLDHVVLPKGKIDVDLIKDHWDDILRLAASIKLRETSSSQVFKRLNSYSAENNPLYLAVKEFGRIPKSLFLLRYIDDEELRTTIQKQLNKGESGNKLDKALVIGRPVYTQSLKYEQEFAESAKRVLKNVIVCWNYMHLSQTLLNTKDPAEKQTLIDLIRSHSAVTWEHFLIHGEFDLSKKKLKDSRKFAFSQFLNPKVVEIWEH